MARTVLNPVTLTTAALDPVASAVAGDNVNGMTFTPKRGRFLWIRNTTVGAINLTIHEGPGATQDAEAPPDRVDAIPANSDRLVAPLPGQYTQSDGTIWLDVPATGTSIAVIDVNG